MLSDPEEFNALEERLAFLLPDSPPQWGSMSSGGMICHLCDSFLFALGERPAKNVSNIFSRTFVRWLALHTPVEWPKNVSTIPEIDQRIGGTPPVSLDSDRTHLLTLMGRFVKNGVARPPHPIFGSLTEKEWQHWGWRHVDHHLRQFGV
jgi:hypothetical protein